MTRLAISVLIAALGAASFGCGKSSPGPSGSKIVTTTSPAYQAGKAQEDEYIRQAHEGEQKALRRRAQSVNDQ